MSFSFCGFTVCDVKPHRGRDRAAAIELDVEIEDVEEAGEAPGPMGVTFCEPLLCN